MYSLFLIVLFLHAFVLSLLFLSTVDPKLLEILLLLLDNNAKVNYYTRSYGWGMLLLFI
jgi:hypothetical protein